MTIPKKTISFCLEENSFWKAFFVLEEELFDYLLDRDIIDIDNHIGDLEFWFTEVKMNGFCLDSPEGFFKTYAFKRIAGMYKEPEEV